MNDPDTSSLLTFQDRFPVREKKLDGPFSEERICDIAHSAAEVLNAIIALEQLSFEAADPEAKGTSAELHRIEQKLDFVTELLARVLQHQQVIPESGTIRMSAERVWWQPKESVQTTDHCLVEIYLSQKYPLPLELPVEVLNIHSERQGEAIAEGRILFTDENLTDDLMRLVFLFHRREIARNRSHR